MTDSSGIYSIKKNIGLTINIILIPLKKKVRESILLTRDLDLAMDRLQVRF